MYAYLCNTYRAVQAMVCREVSSRTGMTLPMSSAVLLTLILAQGNFEEANGLKQAADSLISQRVDLKIQVSWLGAAMCYHLIAVCYQVGFEATIKAMSHLAASHTAVSSISLMLVPQQYIVELRTTTALY